MTDTQPPSTLAVRCLRLLNLPRLVLSAVGHATNWLLTPRPLMVLYFLIATGMLFAAWLEPTLSRPISAWSVPWAGLPGEYQVAQDQSALSMMAIFRLGPALMLLILVGLAVVMLHPRRFGTVCGVLLVATIGMAAGVAGNHPQLVEALDVQQEQRERMISVLTEATAHPLSLQLADETITAEKHNLPGRVAAHQHQGGLLRLEHHIGMGWWLMLLWAVGFIAAQRGSLPKRMVQLAILLCVGGTLGSVVASRRLVAEYHWRRANHWASVGKWSQANDAIDNAVWYCPALDDLQRTWLLRGRVAINRQVEGPHADYFRAHQLAEKKHLDVALAQASDLRERHPDSRAVQYLAGRIACQYGIYAYEHGRLEAARKQWRLAMEYEPLGMECPFYLGLSQARVDPERPDLVAAEFEPLLPRLGDRVLKADILASLGDAHFDAGEFSAAREYYWRSLDMYELPKDVNYRARRGLVGL